MKFVEVADPHPKQEGDSNPIIHNPNGVTV
jgi:hypothetical protein